MAHALVYNAPWDLTLNPQERPDHLDPNDVLVEIHATGICGTDIGIVSGAYKAVPGTILGHETAGTVVATGSSVTAVQLGDRVAVDPTFFCGFCQMCRSGRPNHCVEKANREAGVSCDGAFARYYLSNERFVYSINDRLSFAQATFAEPLSCVLTGLQQLRLRADLETVVFGAGPIGLLFAMALAARGLHGNIAETSAQRRDMARDAAPAGWRVMHPAELDGASCDLAIETSGRALPSAIDMLRRGGQVLQVALSSNKVKIHPASFADKSLSLVGSIDSIGTFGLALTMLENRSVQVEKLITAQRSLDRYAEGFALIGLDLNAGRRNYDELDAIKVLLTNN